MSPPIPWWVVIPLKDTRRAKSRLRGPRGERRRLAIAMAQDTLSAAVEAAGVEGVLAVCQTEDDSDLFSLAGVTVAVREALGINEAITAGALAVFAADPEANIAVLPGDLPYLQPAELDVALVKAATLDSACVADRDGTGTTLFTARAGQALSPAYGEGSLRAHLDGGAIELGMPVWSGLRRDVDEPDDLVVNASLGCRTRELLERRQPAHQVLQRKGA